MWNIIVNIIFLIQADVPGIYKETKVDIQGKKIERHYIFTGKEFIRSIEKRVGPSHPEIRWSDTAVLWVDRNHLNAIAENVRISGDGMHIVAGWWLNNERASLYRTLGNGTPFWSYDIPDADWMIYTGISRNGNSISAQSSGGTTLYKWTKENPLPEWTYPYPFPFIPSGRKATAVSFNGNIVASLASDGNNGRLSVFSAQTGNILYTVDFDPTNGIYGIDLSDDGSIICVTTYNMVYVYEGDSLRGTIPHYGQTDARIDGTGNYLVRGDFNGSVYFYGWDGSNYNQLWQSNIGGPWVTAVDISRDGSTIMAGTGYNNGTVYMFDSSSSAPLWSYQNYGSYGAFIYEVALSGNGGRGITASWGDTASSGNFYVLTIHDKNSSIPVIGVTRDQEPGSLFSCDISDDGTFATAGGKAVHAYQFGNGGEVYSIIVGSAPSINVATASIDNPDRFIQVGQNITPQASFINYGDSAQSFDVYFQIEDSAGIVYLDSAYISNLLPNQTTQVTFSSWVPSNYGYYRALAFTLLPQDQYSGDDSLLLTLKCFHDGAVQEIANPFNEITINQVSPVRVRVLNNGSYTESFQGIAQIFDSLNTLIYAETLTTPLLAPEQMYSIDFSDFTPSYYGLYRIVAELNVTDDFIPSNDTLSKDFLSSYEIIYDDGLPDAWYWVGSLDNDKFAVRFTPTLNPPFYITGGRIMVNATYPFDYVLLCEGTNLPDTVNAIDTVFNVSAPFAPGWAEFSFSQPILRTDSNDLWVVIHWPNSSPTLGVGADNTYPRDYRSFWFNNSQGWNAWNNHDWVIRLQQEVYVSEEEKLSQIKKFRVNLLYSNPVKDRVVLQLSIPERQKIEIALFDVTGRKIKKLFDGFLKTGTHTLRYSLKGDLRNGVYFVEVRGVEKNIFKKVVYLK